MPLRLPRSRLGIGSPATSIYWALVSWWSPYGSTGVPFLPGIVEAETSTSLTLWVATADANYRGGNGLKRTVAGAEFLAADWPVTADGMVSDDYHAEEVDVEVWARVELAATLVNPTMILSAVHGGGRFGYTPEYGTAGKALVKPSSGTCFRFVRLGTLTIPTVAGQSGALHIDATAAAGSTGQFGIDYLVVVPKRSRMLGPTGKPASGYPVFFPASLITKIIEPDNAGRLLYQTAEAVQRGTPDLRPRRVADRDTAWAGSAACQALLARAR